MSSLPLSLKIVVFIVAWNEEVGENLFHLMLDWCWWDIFIFFHCHQLKSTSRIHRLFAVFLFVKKERNDLEIFHRTTLRFGSKSSERDAVQTSRRETLCWRQTTFSRSLHDIIYDVNVDNINRLKSSGWERENSIDGIRFNNSAILRQQ